MSGTILHPPLPKPAGRKPKPVRVVRAVERIGRQEMIDQRDRCMAEIARVRRESATPNSFFDKARQLLTKHWSASSWRSRADILRTAEWLVGVGRRDMANAAPAQEDGSVIRRSVAS
jgi:hypothetical protein